MGRSELSVKEADLSPLSLCLSVPVFAVDSGVCTTVSPLFCSCAFGDWRFDVVWSICECVIRLVVTLCGA